MSSSARREDFISCKEYMIKNYFSLKKYKSVIPFLFTFANALFGFLSIIQVIEARFAAAALCIMAAAFMDAFDGRVARYLGTEGQLGTELDSLCDAVSFCLAPAVLMYSWLMFTFGYNDLFVLVSLLYICAGLFRLARFNITSTDQTIFFIGLPTTIAAFFLVQLVLYQELLLHNNIQLFLSERFFILLVGFLAFLMVSSIRFPAFKQPRISLRDPLLYIKALGLLVFGLWCAYRGYPLVLLGVSLYIFGTVFINGLVSAKKILKKRK